VELRKTNEASPDIEQRSAMDKSTPLDMGDSGEQTSPSKELGSNEARTEMTFYLLQKITVHNLYEDLEEHGNFQAT
jgi:hypothetical protein